MPQRHRGRFSRLEEALRAAGGQAAPGSELGNFKLFREGERHATRRKSTKKSADEKIRYGVSLAPFNIAETATDNIETRYVASMTGFSLAGQTAFGLTAADLGHEKMSDAAGKTAQTADTYFPALIKPIQYTATSGEPEVSGITGNKYSYRPANSYSIPFGRRGTKLDTDTEEDRRRALSTKLKTGTTKAGSVGYEPEVFRGERTALAEIPDAPAAP